MLFDILKADNLGDYKIFFEFEDGKKGVLDFSSFPDRKGVFKDLDDLSYFEKFYVNKELGTICWPRGQDLAPETIYEKLS